MPKMGSKWVIFGPKINIFYLFFKFVQKIFLKMYLMAGIKEWLKVTVLAF